MAQMRFGQQALTYEIYGQPRRPFSDLYHVLMRGSWLRILAFAITAYVALIGSFAGLFLLGGDCIEGAEPGSASDAFWFSVQTFSTIGYGGMLPKTLYAHALVTIESFVGLAGVALMTALMYSRFSRPIARVSFSEKLVVSTLNGEPTLQFRMANERHNRLFDCQMQLHAIVEHATEEGTRMRRMVDLPLEAAKTPMFMMGRVLIHHLDEDSVLHGLSADNINERVIFLLASLSGTDDALMQDVYAHRMYRAEDIVFGKRFTDMIELNGEVPIMYFERLDALEEDTTER